MAAFLNSITFLATPAVSRKTWTLKVSFCVDFLLELMLLEFAIFCITPPLDSKRITTMRLKTRLAIGGYGTV
jgi:hypothetical protein